VAIDVAFIGSCTNGRIEGRGQRGTRSGDGPAGDAGMRAPVDRVNGPPVLLERDDVDTDAIFPARYLKTVERRGLGVHLFADWRDADSALHWARPAPSARNLLAGRNFGCGSSREHAAWSLADAGVHAVLALSFGDIFRTDCIRNEIVAATWFLHDQTAIREAMQAGRSMTIMARSGTTGWAWGELELSTPSCHIEARIACPKADSQPTLSAFC
jgi:3-isopropylmalate/(R)-2-methylmalate dehydratase small subunit